MDAAEKANNLANAISEGINHLAYIRSLGTEPPAASAEDLLELNKAMADFLHSLETIQKPAPLDRMETSFRVSDELIQRIEDVCAHLRGISPGSPLPASFFQAVDLAWAELEKTWTA